MAEPDIVEQIKAVLSGVSGMGVVHGYQRLATSWGKVLDLFKDDEEKINACCISRSGIFTRQATVGEAELAYLFSVRFYMGLKDGTATERVFQALLDDVVDALIINDTLNGACETTHPDWGPMSGAAGLQVETIDHRMFGNVLCHFAEGKICTITSTDI